MPKATQKKKTKSKTAGAKKKSTQRKSIKPREPVTQAQARVGVVLCQCGTNIAEAVDLEGLAAWARTQKNVAFVATHELLCSPGGRDDLRSLLSKNKPSHLVVAACSPRMHEATFAAVANKALLNPGRVHMANIREQAAWVTPDKAAATRKAQALLAAALRRVVLHEDLEDRSMECSTDLVVIGGGVAGIEAALLAAAAGRQVTIVEKNIAVGGQVIQVEELSPHMECAPCLLSPRLSKLKDQPNIRVLANAEVTDVVGFFGNFTVTVKQQARYVKASCIGCEACFDACPVVVASEFHLGLAGRKAIHNLFPGAVPAGAVIDAKSCLHFKDGSCEACVKACPFGAIDFADHDQDYTLPAGAVIVATGFESYHPSDFTALGYGRLPEVYTLPEFERMVNSNGPYQGVLKRRDGAKPKSLAVIHCAGSLTPHGLPYCSGVCCQLAIKVGETIRKQIPEAQVTNYHDRLVLPGTDAEHFYAKQKKAGTRFVRVQDLASLKLSERNGQIKITGRGIPTLVVDMVVLATGLAPSPGSLELAQRLNAETTSDGFMKPAHHFLRQISSTFDGIYAVGACLGPCLVGDAITQAQAAAGEAISRLVPGRRIPLETNPAWIDPQRCSGCKVCISVCPYKAIRYDAQRGVSEINQAICRGCGTCAAACPSGAIHALHFTDAQIQSEVEAILHE